MYDVNNLMSIKKHWLLRTSNIPRRFLGLEIADLVERSGDVPPEYEQWIEDVVIVLVI